MTKLTLEDIKKELSELDSQLGRQHGRIGQISDCDEKELKRLYNNLKSRQSRARKRELEKKRELTYREVLNLPNDADEYGIRPVDRRRYIACFKSTPIGCITERVYVKRMTGLSKNQIFILQKETGLLPVPAVTESEAVADEKRRWETGDYYC